jgi:hypothetical protein
MQVYQLSIGAACGLSWPSDRIIIQILDDSTDPAIMVSICYKASFFFPSNNLVVRMLIIFKINKWNVRDM